jgi:CheY-like chemotaxis protein
LLLEHPLQLRSEIERGTCFTIALPAAVGPVDAAGREDAVDDAAAFAGRRALIVDDDADICDASVRLLTGWGFDARAAANHSAAQALLASGFIPDVILADLRLGEPIDGIEVIERLREQSGRSIPALLISGDTGARELARVRESGLLLLNKPAAPARMRSALNAMLAPAGPTAR